MNSRVNLKTATRKKAPKGKTGELEALRHGFYSRRFSQEEMEDLASSPDPQNLEDEYMLMKVLLRRVVERAQVDNTALGDWLKVLAGSVSAAAQQAALLRTKATLDGGFSELSKALSQAIEDFKMEEGEE